jgi:hypothetical protein
VVRFPQEPKHRLTLRVNEQDQNIANAQTISIYTSHGNYPDYNQYIGGCIDGGRIKRKTDPDSYNMRWAINLSDDHDVPPGYNGIQNPPYGNVLLELTNALFYVARVNPTQLYLVKAGLDANQPSTKKKEFGRASGLIAGIISCQPGGSVYIKINDEKPIEYPAKPEFVHSISFSNMDLDKAEEIKLRSMGFSLDAAGAKNDDGLYCGDLEVYYDSLKAARERYALWGPPIYIKGSRTDCDAVWIENPDLTP